MAAGAECLPQLPSHLCSPSHSSPASSSSSEVAAPAEPSEYQPASSPSLSSASGEQSPVFTSSIYTSSTLPVDYSNPRLNPGNGSNTYCPSTASSDSGIDSPSHQSIASSGSSGISSVIGKDATFSCNGIAISLLEADMWSAFNTVGNEMIVTKPGR